MGAIMNNDTMLTDHFSWAESIITQHRGVSNEIKSPAVFENIPRTAVKLEKVRALLDCPIVINSWYRSDELNAAVGGVRNSDHLTGCAVDFIAPKFGTPTQIAMTIRENAALIGFKQLILEHTWVHISFPIPGVAPKLEVLSLLEGGRYAQGLTNKFGQALG
jgi:zinc D-Ala-D-Ala carboxypeptidase